MRYTIDIWYCNQYQGNWKNCGYSFPSRIDAKLWMMIEHPNIREDDYRIKEIGAIIDDCSRACSRSAD